MPPSPLFYLSHPPPPLLFLGTPSSSSESTSFLGLNCPVVVDVPPLPAFVVIDDLAPALASLAAAALFISPPPAVVAFIVAPPPSPVTQ